MGGVPTGQAAVSRRLHAAILLLLFWSAASAEVDPGVYLERQVLVPFRLWDAANQEYMTDLSRIRLEDFRIREDNLEQIPLSVDLERRPLSLVLAVDISGSMADSLPSVRQAARRLGDRLKQPDRIAVLSFNREVVLLSRPSEDRQLLRRNLAELHSWGFTAVFDAIHEGLATLKHEPDPRAIIVLTDGADNRSTRSMEQVAAEARKARIPLFFICHKVNPSGFGDLVEAAEETGGRVFRSARDQDFLRIFGTIADGLRSTFILAYRPDRPWDDNDWRKLSVRYGTRRLKFDSFKTGYYPEIRPEDPGSPPVLNEGGLTEPYPPEFCPRRDSCDQPLDVAVDPGPPERLTVEGWLDVGHDMGAMVHPTRYEGTEPIPDDPRSIDLKYWPFQRAYARPDQIAILLPEPDALPRSAGSFWESILSSGALFHVTGMDQVQPSEYRPAEKRMTIPPVPGLARHGEGSGPQQIWWIDGRLTADFREIFSRWIFTLMPSYRRWTEEHYREMTESVVEQEVQAAIGRVKAGLPEKVQAGITAMVQEEVREARRRQWSSIESGAAGPTEHLLPRHPDVQAADWLAAADAVLVDRLLAGPVPDPESLETDWQAPARAAWSRLRKFFSPSGHQSLTPGIPFLDETNGAIHLQRVILPWVEQRAGERYFGRFPATAPAGLLTVAELLGANQDGALLAHGSYRCQEDGVSVTPGFSREAEQRPAEWLLKVETLLAEKQRLREIRRRLGPEEGRFILQEEQELERELRHLRRPSGTRVEVVLRRAGASGVGIRLTRDGDRPTLAAPLREPGIILAASSPEQLADLAALAERNGVDLSEPAVANAILAAGINGLDGASLMELLAAGGPSGCLAGGSYRTIRLRWRDAAHGIASPARLLQEDPGPVLEIDLASTSRSQLQDALAGLCRARDD
ncbi:MAG: VWA domain-containing protein [Acidobacteria bacterium]|uniref:VWA domain-containing protein n=1 Tax=Candidatus Polarisedimenticola svalbardensis TaxID=2886004 RepID=A0A8J6Y2F4_9BACT|nr:VWA domain-containing protein [Candidatus Polarisedimenticola svalbardensis]